MSVLLPWRRQPFPVPWREVFGRSAPLHLEVGFGDARYTVARALDKPEEDFVALEISAVSVLRGLRRVGRERPGNVRLLKLGAQFAVRNLFEPETLASITVNFPDPWPKERHAGNRLLRRPFLDVAASRLQPGAALLLATDHPEYLAFACEQGAASGLYQLEERQPPPAVFETKYALKWRDQGKPLHYLAFVRNACPAPEFPALERQGEMPHALLQGDPPKSLLLEKTVVPYADGHVILQELTRSLAQEAPERWLVRVTVDEPDLKQQLLVVFQRRAGGEFIVRLEPFGDPVLTRTVRGAVHAVTEWLLDQGGLELRERNY